MTIFRVTVVGSGLKMTVEDVEGAYGFIKNHYIRALTPEEAATNSLEAVRTLLFERTNIHATKLAVEEVEAAPPWRLFVGQGFVFYPEEEAS